MSWELQKGTLLVSVGDPGCPLLQHSVVLLCDLGMEGAFGLAINQAAECDLLDEILDIDEAELAEIGVRASGPLFQEQMFVLHGAEPQGERFIEVLPGVRLGGDPIFLQHLLLHPEPPPLLLCFGHCSWGPGQLEEEILTGEWVPIPGAAAVVFDPEPWSLWKRLVSQLGPPYHILATFPEDLTQN